MTAYAVGQAAGGVLPANFADDHVQPPPAHSRRGAGSTLSLGQGQVVIVVARWILVLAGLLLAIWNPAQVGELRLQIVVLLGLAVANFFLHAQLLTRKPVQDVVVYAASAADAAVITALILSQGGFSSDLYIFYYVAVLAFSIAFPTRDTALFTGVIGSIYGLIGLGSLDVSDHFHHASGETHLVLLGARLIVLAGVAFCGNLYWRLERTRRLAASVETAEDIFFGQTAIIWGRWFVILAAALVALWTAATPGELSAKMVLVAALMGMNFFLHGRALLEKPANAAVVLAASALDVALVTAMVWGWQSSTGGVRSDLFVLYYPVLLAFAFVFRPRQAIVYTAGTVAVYAATCLLSEPQFVFDGSDLKTFVARLLTLAATGGLGAFYWRVLRARRRSVVAPRPTTLEAA